MFLDQIVSQTLKDLEQRKQECSLSEMMLLAAAQPPPRDLLEALRPKRSADSVNESAGAEQDAFANNQTEIRLIAEVKRASPSKGLLAP
ncbi:MAG TPA: hypothetical protein DIU08_07395, partial [Ktedonobacter sp.]|nr:hypothetical protein [Ktedonobacter sp.]HCP74452.1 hypothetical protein [Ktedonobacter sp.]